MKVNLENISLPVKFVPLENGIYNCMIVSCEIKVSDGGSPMLVTEYMPIVEDDTIKDRRIKDFNILDKEWGLSKLKLMLIESGVECDLVNLDLTKLVSSKCLIGKQLSCNIVKRKFTNKSGVETVNNTIGDILSSEILV